MSNIIQQSENKSINQKNRENKKKSEKEIKIENRRKFYSKMSDLKGNGFEGLIQYTISNRFFLEELKVDNLPNINDIIFVNPSFDIKEIRNDILLKLTIEPGSKDNINLKRISFQNEFNKNLFNYFCKQELYNSIYEAPTDYYSTNTEVNNISNNSKKVKEKPKRKMNSKDISELEFDLFMKKIESKKLIDYLNEMQVKKRAFELIKGDEIKEGEFFNLCFEITIQSKDVIKKKIPQLYKFISFFNFMYKMNEFFDNEKYNEEEKSVLSLSKGYFLNKAKIFDFRFKIVILLVCDGIEEDFDELKNDVINLRKEENNNSLKMLQNINENNYNVFLVYYPIYDPKDKIYKILENQQNELNEVKAKLSYITTENKNLKKALNNYQSYIYLKKRIQHKYPFKKIYKLQ